MTDGDPKRADGSGAIQSIKQRPDCPAPGWAWVEVGPRGPAWYPPIVEGIVDATREHMALCPVDGDRHPGNPLAVVGCGKDDTMVAHFLVRNADTTAAVERLFFSCIEEMGIPPRFELGYEFCGKTANKQYADPMWVYVSGS